MRISLLITFCFAFLACNQNVNESNVAVSNADENVAVVENDASEDVAREKTIQLPAPPPASEKRKENEKKESLKSIFLNLGCCAQEKERLDDCCCFAVLGKYKTLHERSDPQLGSYKMNDPILGNCRRKMAKEFEAIDSPKVDQESDNDDELF